METTIHYLKISCPGCSSRGTFTGPVPEQGRITCCPRCGCRFRIKELPAPGTFSAAAGSLPEDAPVPGSSSESSCGVDCATGPVPTLPEATHADPEANPGDECLSPEKERHDYDFTEWERYALLLEDDFLNPGTLCSDHACTGADEPEAGEKSATEGCSLELDEPASDEQVDDEPEDTSGQEPGALEKIVVEEEIIIEEEGIAGNE